MATQRQIDANQKNAALSTGPKTEEGKAISRCNGVKHGLSGEGIVCSPEEMAERDAKRELWRPMYESRLQGADPDRERLFEEVVVNSLRIDQAQRREVEIQHSEHQRAIEYWESDRELKAQNLGKELAKQKSVGLTLAKLKSFSQGLEWLVAQWSYLKLLLENGEDLKEAKLSMYENLLGVPVLVRLDGRTVANEKARATVVENLKALEGRIETAKRHNDRERIAAQERGFIYETSKEECLNRRYENLARRRFDSASKQLKSAKPVPAAPQYAPPAPKPQPLQISQPPQMNAPTQAVAADRDRQLRDALEEGLMVKPKPKDARDEPSGTLGKMIATSKAQQDWNTTRGISMVPVGRS